MQNDIQNLIDDRNINLWLEMSKKYDILLMESFEPNYMINFRKRFLQKSRAKIYYLKNDIRSSSFTHELLHLKIKSKQILIYDDFFNSLKKNNDLNYIFSHQLKQHIGNCLEHIKMLPIFIEMGYNSENFICDYHVIKMSNKELNEIQNGYVENGIYNREAVDFYIGKFFAMKACNNSTFDYSNFYSQLEEIDKYLYGILSDFWNSWINYDIENGKAYRNLLAKFFVDLNNWKKGKLVI